VPDRRDHVDPSEQPTEVIPTLDRHPTEVIPAVARWTGPGLGAGGDHEAVDGEQSAFRRWLTAGPHWLTAGLRWLTSGSGGFAVAAVLGVLALAYLLDLLAGQGDVPRGVRVAGVRVGGMPEAVARTTLVDSLGPDLRRDVFIEAGPVRTSLSPANAGLRVDWDATVAEAARQPLNPITRLTSFFTTRDMPLVSQADETRLGDALDGIASLVRREAMDGGVRFAGTTPVAVHPTPGVQLDLVAAESEIKRDWVTGRTVRLPTVPVEPAGRVTEAAISRAITEVAMPAVSAPVRVIGDGGEARLSPEVIAGALSFVPDGVGGLKPVLHVPELADAVRPQLASTERPAKDATVTLVHGAPVVTPSVNGYGVDYPATFALLVDVLKRSIGREVTARYADQPARLTTERVTQLGITGVISTFTTGGFATDSGQNIKRAAEAINGEIVMPGETFSLNAATGPRDGQQGYVPAGVITEGRPGRGVGGGVSQLATTVYNAAYFAGMTDVSHTEHSYYISRYPVAREATVFEGAIDLKFRNDLPTGVLIETVWTPADITVRFWGTKRYEVTSATSPRSDLVPPPTLTLPPGDACTPGTGAPGFTATDTRTMKNLVTGETTTRTHTVHYKPSPTVVCGAAPAPSN
jgi:vancomycin resistance protein YoaR